jgi:murein L,D-transpeptidase YafK
MAVSVVRWAASLLALASLTGCMTAMDDVVVASPSTAVLGYAAASAASFDPARQPILVRIFKEESELEVWRRGRDGTYAVMKTYPICAWSGALGPKTKNGDRQAPEGFYEVAPKQMNAKSQYKRSFDLGYPNAYDRSHGATGSHLMVHGSCRSAGCYAMDDRQIEEIFALVGRSFATGAASVQVQALPFRMTAENMARHAKSPNMPFWRMLKQGSDIFETTRLPVEVGECRKAYAFGPVVGTGDACVPAKETAAVAAKRIADELQEAKLVRLLDADDFAPVPTVRWEPGIQANPAAYATEQNRREGYDVDGNPVSRPGVFSQMLGGRR